MPGPGFVALLQQNRNFRRLWIGQVVSQLGDWIDYVALMTLLLALTDSGTVVAMSLVARFLPAFLVAPMAGVVVDRVNRKHLMIAADLARGILVLGFLLIRRPEDVWIAYVVSALAVSVTSFFEPARTATIPNVTGPDELVTANTISAATWSLSLGIGSALGGLVTAAYGSRAAFVLDSASYFCSAWMISGIGLRLADRTTPRAVGLAGLLGLTDLIEGARYLRRNPSVGTLVLVKTGWALSGGLILLQNIFGQRVYPVWGSAAAGIGLLAMARGLGTAFGPLASRGVVGSDLGRMAIAIGGGFFVLGAFYIVFAWVRHLPLALLALIVAHIGASNVWVFSTTLLQKVVPDEFRGRVFATELALLTLGLTLSSFATGWALDHLGLGPRMLCAVIGVLFFVPGVLWLMLQRLPRFRVT